MSRINENPDPVKLIVNMFYKDRRFLADAMVELERLYGEMDGFMEPIPFGHSSYYDRELGSGLSKVLVSFKKLISRDTLPDVKHAASQIEKQLSRETEDGPKRLVNIDPGQLQLEKYVLSSGKNFPQRIYLRKGIYAELTLIYRHGRYESLPWTYMDYLEPEVLQFLDKARLRLIDELRSKKKHQPKREISSTL